MSILEAERGLSAEDVYFTPTVVKGEVSMRSIRTAVIGVTALLSVVVAVPADAGTAEDVGSTILSCFHPTGRFRSATLGEAYKNGSGYNAVDGRVEFLGILTDNRYHMNFTIVMRTVDSKKEFKVIPGEDTAPFPPSENCRLRSWTEKD